jgi:N-acyl-D-amino-acid deacylase
VCPTSCSKVGCRGTGKPLDNFSTQSQERKPAINVISLMGQSALRAYVMGDEAMTRREANREEIEAMKEVVREGMRAGAAGFSV